MRTERQIIQELDLCANQPDYVKQKEDEARESPQWHPDSPSYVECLHTELAMLKDPLPGFILEPSIGAAQRILELPDGHMPAAGDSKVLAAAVYGLYMSGQLFLQKPQSEVLSCVYCGHQYIKGTPAAKHQALFDHIRECPEHPLSKALALLKEARDCFGISCNCGDDCRQCCTYSKIKALLDKATPITPERLPIATHVSFEARELLVPENPVESSWQVLASPDGVDVTGKTYEECLTNARETIAADDGNETCLVIAKITATYFKP